MKKIVVIGGGYSGLMVSLMLDSKKYDITILEKESELGKKILVTGNGRCNFWNDDMDIRHFHSRSLDDMSMLIKDESISKSFKFFETLGIEYKVKNGYYYPYTNKASTIRDTLLYEINRRNIEVKTDYLVETITKKGNKYVINNNIESDLVIICSGGIVYNNKNSGHYDLIEKLNHTLIKPLPSLTKLNSTLSYDWQGIREDGKVSIYVDDKFIKSEIGEIQFTKTGISGICVFNISRFASIGLYDHKKVYVLIDFMPGKDDIISYLNTKDVKLPVYELLSRLINRDLVKIILERSHIKRNVIYKNLSELEKKRLEENIKRFRVDISSTGSYKEAQVTSGGIDLREINLDNLESKLNKNLFMTGEILDIDGDCGGYNLGFGLISAYKVAEYINKNR